MCFIHSYNSGYFTNTWVIAWFMVTSSNGNIFHVTDHLCGEFTGHRWIPGTHKGQWRGVLMFFFYLQLSKQSWGWWFETSSHPLWRQCNVVHRDGILNYYTDFIWAFLTGLYMGNLLETIGFPSQRASKAEMLSRHDVIMDMEQSAVTHHSKLLTKNHSMDKYWHACLSVRWNLLSIPRLQKGCTVEVWEWLSNFTSYWIIDVITYACRDLRYSMLMKGAPGTSCLFIDLRKTCHANLVKEFY